jgi:hypothetical protein
VRLRFERGLVFSRAGKQSIVAGAAELGPSRIDA